MAFRRSLSERATIVARQCHRPSISHLLRERAEDDGDLSRSTPIAESASPPNLSALFQNRRFGSGAGNSFFGLSRDRRFSNSVYQPSSTTGILSRRFMSTTMDDGSDKFGIIADVAEVISDTAVQSTAQIAAANEVAIAAADSFFPVKMLQYVIEGVHTYAGVNWWAAIALTTLVIRLSTVPILINQLKSTSKLTLMRPRMEELKEQMQNGNLDTFEGQRQMTNLFKEHGVTPFTPLKGLLIQGPVFISFFLAISNMAEKVPSFKSGGTAWFVDLTTADALYIFPVLTAMTFLLTVECNMQEGMEGNPVAGTMKKFSRVFAVLTVPFTMSFPKAIFCYWITSNLFSLGYGLVIKKPAVKKFLAIPDMPIPPPADKNAKPFSFTAFYSELKQAAEKHAQNATGGQSQSIEAPKPVVDKKALTSSVISQRLKTLEKQVKGRKKNKNK